MVHYLGVEEILLIHSLIIDETGGSHGVRDRHALQSLAESPRQSAFGNELYPTLFHKAAVYVRNIIHFHPFVDGNKRSAMTTASIFPEENDFVVTAIEGEIEEFALRVGAQKMEINEIAVWLKRHSKKAETKEKI